MCFQYVVTVALNYKTIKKGRQRITKIQPFIYQCKSNKKNKFFYEIKRLGKV